MIETACVNVFQPHDVSSGPPPLNSLVMVKWTDGIMYKATFKGTNDVCVDQVQTPNFSDISKYTNLCVVQDSYFEYLVNDKCMYFKTLYRIIFKN